MSRAAPPILLLTGTAMAVPDPESGLLVELFLDADPRAARRFAAVLVDRLGRCEPSAAG